MEQWNPITHNTEYLISSTGKVYDTKKKRNVMTPKSGVGYPVVSLRSENGKRKNLHVHRLVAEAFIEPVEGKTLVNHKNGIKDDNRVENLEWCTAKENIHHWVRMGAKKSVKGIGRVLLTTEIQERIFQLKESGLTNVSIGKIVNMNNRPVGLVVRGELKPLAA